VIVIEPLVLAQMALSNRQGTGEAALSKDQVSKETAASFDRLLTKYLEDEEMPPEAETVWPVRKKQGELDLSLISLAATFAPTAEQTHLTEQDVGSDQSQVAPAGVSTPRGLWEIPETASVDLPEQARHELEFSLEMADAPATQGVPLPSEARPQEASDLTGSTEKQGHTHLAPAQPVPDDQLVSPWIAREGQDMGLLKKVAADDQKHQVMPWTLGAEEPRETTLRSVRSDPVRSVGELLRTDAEAEVEMGDPTLMFRPPQLVPSATDVGSSLKLPSLQGIEPAPQELVAEVSDDSPRQAQAVLTQSAPLQTTEEDVDTLAMGDQTVKEELGRGLAQENPRLTSEQGEPLDEAKIALKGASTERPRSAPAEVPMQPNNPTLTPLLEIPAVETEIRAVLDIQDRDNLLPRLVETIETLVYEERSEVRMQLKPDHLGSLEVKLSMERGIMVAEFIVQDQQVREIIASQLPQLQTALQDQGTHMADVSVSIGLGHRGADGEGQQRSKQQHQQSYGRLRESSVMESEKAYLGRNIWNQVDVRV